MPTVGSGHFSFLIILDIECDKEKQVLTEKKIVYGIKIYILFFYVFQFLECLMKKEYVVAAKLCKMSE